MSKMNHFDSPSTCPETQNEQKELNDSFVKLLFK
jgi:hypothetical protein